VSVNGGGGRTSRCGPVRFVLDSPSVRILVSNDDGIGAPGLEALAAVLEKMGRVFVCAPESARSGSSSSLTLHEPLQVRRLGPRRWSVRGNPADAVKIALRELLPAPPDLVVAGINDGLNCGVNILYSGTVAAALEGAQYGIPSFALSRRQSGGAGFREEALRALRLVRGLHALRPREAVVFNINFPGGTPKGIRVTVAEPAPYRDRYHRRRDPRGRVYYWLSGEPPRRLRLDGRATDEWAVSRGYVSVTPLRRDLTDRDLLGDLERGIGTLAL